LRREEQKRIIVCSHNNYFQTLSNTRHLKCYANYSAPHIVARDLLRNAFAELFSQPSRRQIDRSRGSQFTDNANHRIHACCNYPAKMPHYRISAGHKNENFFARTWRKGYSKRVTLSCARRCQITERCHNIAFLESAACAAKKRSR
jgi:hypothetical protein